jgi:hypothetical protein
VAEVKEGLSKLNLWGNSCVGSLVYCRSYVHWVFRDASGKSLVLEYPDAEPHFFDDVNDGVNTFGIMTNEPNFEYHLMNVQHLLWKRTLARQAVPVPGSWYPEDRFMRAYMVKSAMPLPTSSQEAVAYAVAALNVVTVPMGNPPGTDTGAAWPAGHRYATGDRTRDVVTQRAALLTSRVRTCAATTRCGAASVTTPTRPSIGAAPSTRRCNVCASPTSTSRRRPRRAASMCAPARGSPTRRDGWPKHLRGGGGRERLLRDVRFSRRCWGVSPVSGKRLLAG